MEDNKILILNNVSVRYRKSDSRSTADIIRRIIKKEKRSNAFWALRNISFSLDKGDMLGVIGKNGAGKSTMMKAISGTLAPASGTIKKEGTLCALLELGTGFDRDMTVKENVYLRGALLGYSKEFIDSKYDEIIDFADMREFEDNPFRTLSSGMKSRIAFSIASMVEPDIIILDEVFAVGDGLFRKKSQQRMQEIINNGSTTAIMVSHSLQSVRDQCNKVLWLDKGRMVMFGDPNTVCDAYKNYLDTGKLPETAALKATEKNPENMFARSKRKVLANTLLYVFLTLVALVGAFVWAQYDLLKSYNISQSVPVSQISEVASSYHETINEALNVDTSKWDYTLFKVNAPKIANDEMSAEELGKLVLKNAGIVSGDDYRIQLAAAEIEAVKQTFESRMSDFITEIKSDYAQQPEGRHSSLMTYAYTNCLDFFKIEETSDDEMQKVIEFLRTELRKQGQPEDTADKVLNIYKTEKIYLLAGYFEKLS